MVRGVLRTALACLLWAPLAQAESPPGSDETRAALAALLLDGARSGQRLIVVGERGSALRSDDEGASWQRAKVAAPVLLTAVHMTDGPRGWAVGHDATVLRSENRGETWTVVHSNPGWQVPLLDVWFGDDRTGVAVGAFGLVLLTSDGGASWRCGNGCWAIGNADEERTALLAESADAPEPDFHLNALAAADAERLYLAGEAGAIYRSDNAGRSWRPLPSPYHGSWFAALAVDFDTLLVAGLRGNLFRSADAGASWTPVETGTAATLTSLSRLPDGRILATGLGGELLVSEDEGRSFRRRPLPSRQDLAAALPVEGGVLLLGLAGLTRLSPGLAKTP